MPAGSSATEESPSLRALCKCLAASVSREDLNSAVRAPEPKRMEELIFSFVFTGSEVFKMHEGTLYALFEKYKISQNLRSTSFFLRLRWQVFRSVPTEEVPFWADVVLGFRKMTEAELKRFPQYEFGQAFTTLKCETAAYLPWLEKRLVEMSLFSCLT